VHSFVNHLDVVPGGVDGKLGRGDELAESRVLEVEVGGGLGLLPGLGPTRAAALGLAAGGGVVGGPLVGGPVDVLVDGEQGQLGLLPALLLRLLPAARLLLAAPLPPLGLLVLRMTIAVEIARALKEVRILVALLLVGWLAVVAM